MVNVEKQVEYWKKGAVEDWEVADKLTREGKSRHGLFFAHLAMEKILKAHFCRRQKDLASPKIHDLMRLADFAKIELRPEQRDTLAEFNAFQLIGRYPGDRLETVTAKEAQSWMERGEKVFQWLTKQL